MGGKHLEPEAGGNAAAETAQFRRPVKRRRLDWRRGVSLSALACAFSAGPAAMAFADDVFINDRFPLQNANELSPPRVDATNECSPAVRVSSVVPHATVIVTLNGMTQIGGPFVVKYGSAAVPLNATHPQLKSGDRITATQTVNGLTSQPTDPPMVVGSMPPTLPPPVVDPKIYACGQVVPVTGLVPGVSVEVKDFAGSTDPNAPSAGIGKGQTPNDWGNDWAPVVTPSLTEAHQLRAVQSSCTGVVSGLSVDPAAVLKDPPVNPPKIEPWVPRGDAVTLSDLFTGAGVKVVQDGKGIGGGLATGERNWIGVAPPLTSSVVEAEQSLCSPSPVARQTPSETLPAPVLVGPICPDQPEVVVRNSTVNAPLVLLIGGSIHGYGGAELGDAHLNVAPPARFANGDVVQVGEYLGNAVSLSNQVTVGCHFRRNIASLNPDGPEIQSLRRGVAVMMSRPDTDPTSWAYQANIHGTYDPRNLASWNQCQHAGYYFFPWHRMYLYYFERILRAASGDPNLTLPYWNYSDPPPPGFPNPRLLPAVFRSPADPGNPLYVANRDPTINAGGLINPSAVDYSQAFLNINFEGAPGNGVASFGGPPGLHHDTTPFNDQGALEQTPHGAIHGSIRGLMGDPNRSAQDPIFYLHHANIDRLWAKWLREGGGRQDPTGDPIWMNQTFDFFDETGSKVTLASKDVLDILGQLSYCYDDDPKQCR